jgi:VanZ family protein
MPVTLLRRLDPWAPPLLLMGLIFFLSAQPHLHTDLGVIDTIARKLVHFGEYGLLTFLWWRALCTRMDPGRAVFVALALSSLYAASDELHQTFVQGRVGTPVDWVIDTAGATAVALSLRARARTTA